MVAGHDVVMDYVDYLIQKGIKVDALQFRLCDKTFHFGGDRELHSEWSVHLPVWIANKYGRLQCFIVEGNTPMLLGRPILKALKVKVNYDDDTYSVDGSPWAPVPTGDKKEHLIQLDFGLDPKNLETEPQFDLMTTDTFDIIHYDNNQDSETFNIHHYLQHTDRSPPEHILNTNDLEQNSEQTHQQPNSSTNTTDDDEDENTVKKMITDKLVCSFRTHLASTNNRQRHVMEQILRAHDGRRLQFWEVYAGSGNLAEAMRKKGYDVKTFDINNGWDFTQSSHRRALLKLHYEQMPDFVWIAPPCTKWSPLQRISIKTPEQAEALQADRDFEEHTHLKLTEQLHTRQKRSGRHAAAEQPQRADSWKTDTFQSMDGHDATVHQCQYGASMPDEQGNEQYIRKATTLRATHKQLADALTRICPGDHYHLPIEGSSPGVGNRAAASAQYPPDMCQHWANIIDNFMKQHYLPTTEQAYEGDDDDDEAAADNMQLDAAAEETEHAEQPAQANNTGILTRLQESTKQAAQRTAQRLHRNLGHPTNKELQKILQKKGASSTLLEAVDHLRCDLCERHRPPPQPPKSNLKQHSEFNSRILADAMWIQLSTQHTRPTPVLTIIDSSTKLMAARVLNSEQTTDFISALERGWIRHFGAPHTLQIDEARGWSSETLRSWSSDHGIFLEISPGQAHTRLSVLERGHQLLRRAVELFVKQHLRQRDVDPRAAIETALIYVVRDIVNTSRGFRDACDLKGARLSRAWSSVALTMCEVDMNLFSHVYLYMWHKHVVSKINKKRKKAQKEKQKEQNQKEKKDRSELNSHDNRALQKRQEPLGPKKRVSKTRQDLFSLGRLKSSLALLCFALLASPASASSTLVDCQSTGLTLSVQINFTYTFSPETPVLGAPQGNSSARWAAPWSPSLELLQSCPRLQCLFDAWKVLWQKACRHVEKVASLFLRKSLSFGNWFTPKDHWLPLFYLWFGFWGILAFWGWEGFADPVLKRNKNINIFGSLGTGAALELPANAEKSADDV